MRNSGAFLEFRVNSRLPSRFVRIKSGIMYWDLDELTDASPGFGLSFVIMSTAPFNFFSVISEWNGIEYLIKATVISVQIRIQFYN